MVAPTHILEIDEKYAPFIQAPLTIETAEHAQEILDYLNTSIASIEGQLDAAAILAGRMDLPQQQIEWVKRATFACAMKKRDYHKVFQRYKALTGGKGPNSSNPEKVEERRVKQEANLVKYERLKLEAENRREAHKLKQEALAIQRLQLENKAREQKLELLRLQEKLASNG